MWKLLACGAAHRDLDAWRLQREVSRASLRAWYAQADTRVRSLEVAVGARLRARGCGDFDVLVSDCRSRGLE
eukprot:3538967-Alexandrium_andersonii.AAC.1